jgi:hypothetical protein
MYVGAAAWVLVRHCTYIKILKASCLLHSMTAKQAHKERLAQQFHAWKGATACWIMKVTAVHRVTAESSQQLHA